MPGYDKRGPWGQGPRTGGGFGFCGSQTQGTDTDVRAYGIGFGPGGRGFQRGFRRGLCFFDRGRNAEGFVPRRATGMIQPDPARTDLQAEAADLRRRLEAIEQRLAGMGGSGIEPKQA